MLSKTPNFNFLNGANILVTGGTGSFGNALIDYIVGRYEPNKLIVYSRDELKQFELKNRLEDKNPSFMRYFIGDVRDERRLNVALQGVDYVIHAAAMKHVPIAEYNPFETIKTNILGGQNLIYAAVQNQVKKVVALSTDKAAAPLNLYGTTKLASDKLMVAAKNMFPHAETDFAVVRYGNVVGSRGSVIPFFQKCIDEGRDTLPVTDRRMTRFWITLQEGVEFVLSSLGAMKGGEIFVPKIPSSTVLDLAKVLKPDAEIKEVGIRPGEKLHEVMVPPDEARNTVEFEDYYVIQPAFAWWDKEEYLGHTEAKPVREDFQYSSDNNPYMLNVDQLRLKLQDLGYISKS